jgi:WD40 repeat protein
VQQVGSEEAGSYWDLAFSPDGARLVSSFAREGVGYLRFWDTSTRTLEMEVEAEFRFDTELGMSPDGSIVAIGTLLVDTSTGEQLTRLGDGDNVVFSSDNSRIATRANEFDITLWDGQTFTELATSQDQFGYFSGNRLFFGPDNKLWVRPIQSAFGFPLFSPVTFNPTGETFIHLTTGLYSHSPSLVRVCDSVSGQQKHVLESNPGTNAVSFSPDGAIFALNSGNGTVTLYNSITYSEIATFDVRESNSSFVTTELLAFSPDGKILAFTEYDYSRYSSVRLWDVEAHEELARIEAHVGQVNNLAFRPDGRLLMTTGQDGTIRLWGIPAS